MDLSLIVLKCHITFVSIFWSSEYLLLILGNFTHMQLCIKYLFEFVHVILFAPKSQFFTKLLNIICRNKLLTKKMFYQYTIVIKGGENTQKRDLWQQGLTPESIAVWRRGSSPGETKICLVNSWYVYTICSLRLALSLRHRK